MSELAELRRRMEAVFDDLLAQRDALRKENYRLRLELARFHEAALRRHDKAEARWRVVEQLLAELPRGRGLWTRLKARLATISPDLVVGVTGTRLSAKSLRDGYRRWRKTLVARNALRIIASDGEATAE